MKKIFEEPEIECVSITSENVASAIKPEFGTGSDIPIPTEEDNGYW